MCCCFVVIEVDKVGNLVIAVVGVAAIAIAIEVAIVVVAFAVVAGEQMAATFVFVMFLAVVDVVALVDIMVSEDRAWVFCLLFVWSFSYHSRIFHSFVDVSTAGEGLQILTDAQQ